MPGCVDEAADPEDLGDHPEPAIDLTVASSRDVRLCLTMVRCVIRGEMAERDSGIRPRTGMPVTELP